MTGCANLVRQPTLRDQLRDHGPQPLSGNNPYLASNLLLSEEMQKSDTISGFVKLRGAPDALEVRRPLFKPYRLYFFYLDNNEGYLLEELRDASIIRGPEQIPEEVKGSLKSVTPLGGKAALGKKKVAKPYEAETSAKPVDKPAKGKAALDALPAKNVRALPARPVKMPPAKPTTKEEAPALPAAHTSDQEAADVTPTHSTPSASQDVMHEVRFAGETLRIISLWYTGDVANASRIARINGLGNADLLQMGQTVRVLRYLLKNSTALPESAIQSYSATGGQLGYRIIFYDVRFDFPLRRSQVKTANK